MSTSTESLLDWLEPGPGQPSSHMTDTANACLRLHASCYSDLDVDPQILGSDFLAKQFDWNFDVGLLLHPDPPGPGSPEQPMVFPSQSGELGFPLAYPEQLAKSRAPPAPMTMTSALAPHRVQSSNQTQTVHTPQQTQEQDGPKVIAAKTVASTPLPTVTLSTPPRVNPLKRRHTVDQAETFRPSGLPTSSTVDNTTKAAPATATTNSQSRATSSNQGQQQSDRPHYGIEKRYRAGLNSKFEALRKRISDYHAANGLVTSLSNPACGEGNGEEDPPSKMNKGYVLEEAVACIQKLSEDNAKVKEKCYLLSKRAAY